MLSASSTLCSLKTEEIEEDMITKNKLKKSTSDFNFFKRSSNSLDDISTCKLGSSDTLSSQSSSQSEIAIQELVQFQQLRMEKKIEREKYKDFLREKNLIYLKSISNLSEKNFDNADSSNDIPQENIDLPTVQSIQKEVLETEIDFILNEMVKCSDPLEDNPVEVENDEIIEAEVDNLQIANDKCTPINECIKFSVSLDKVILERELSKTISQLKNQTEVDNPNVNFSYSISDKVDTNENSDGEFMVESIEVVLKLKKKN
ncbi:hypothetical protein HK099_007465 [Clydaea vesicula]|uniref:Uncharacterized protein n=1 Tax=Clydaea vesicula TaxID=447962 RepID=A0AAD5TWT3_9FUNG|nr:hypothetical protein HK099_007465 [Clydaea vesicula]